VKEVPEMTQNSSDQNDYPVLLGSAVLPIGEHWETSIRDLGGRAIRLALADAGNPKPDAVYIGNAYASVLSHQANLGALLTEYAGLEGVESCTFEAAGASGAAAFRAACQAVQSGMIDVAVVLGVEKITECEDSQAAQIANLELNYEFETSQGLTTVMQAALIAQNYLHTYGLDRSVFKSVAVNSFLNAAGNPNAMIRSMTEARYQAQGMLADPLGVFDFAMLADGAAAIVLTRAALVPAEKRDGLIRVCGSAGAIAPLSLHDRPDLIHWSAAAQSAASALRRAGLRLANIDLFEIWDGSVIDAVLALESIGVCKPGHGWQVDPVRLNLTGGCLGRGNPVGASGVYQLAEISTLLKKEKLENGTPQKALVQAIAGCGATAITHILAS